MVTAMGRETLQRTVDITQNKVGLEVIYGDTDSIMINTKLNLETDLDKVKELGERVKREVNRLYRTLELEIDGTYSCFVLLGWALGLVHVPAHSPVLIFRGIPDHATPQEKEICCQDCSRQESGRQRSVWTRNEGAGLGPA
jgi:DNA polymerase family B